MKLKAKCLMITLICLNSILCATSQQKIEKARESDPQYQYNLGLFHLNNNHIDEAIRYFQKALSLNPRYFLSLNALGLAYSMKGNLQESVKAFQRCLEINPLFSEARNNLGSIYQEMGFIERAEEEYKKAIADENYQSRELPHYNLARLYFAMDGNEDALQHVNRSIQINSRLAMAHNLKGLVLEKLDRASEAVASYERAVKIVPDDFHFNFNLAAACFKTDETQRAKEIFEKIAGQAPDAEMREKISEYLKMIRNRQK